MNAAMSRIGPSTLVVITASAEARQDPGWRQSSGRSGQGGWPARLEQRRGPQPSEQMLASLARALRLTSGERDYLFRHERFRGSASSHWLGNCCSDTESC
jgi:hypothetical protein